MRELAIPQTELREIRVCEVCGSDDLKPVLDLGPQPLCDDLIPIGDPATSREYPIEILLCRVCITAHQRFQVPKHVLFPPGYHYRARFTGDVISGMDQLVSSYELRFGAVADRSVLDIGCNDGSLLGIFRDRGARTVGVEPTDAFRDAIAAGHSVVNGFLSPDLAAQLVRDKGPFDVITFTNVFAHIEDLPAVLESIRQLIQPTTVIVIENHYLGSILRGNQFDTFYHEHPRTYSYCSFLRVARDLGLEVLDVEFPSRYGGNIRVYLGDPRSYPVQQRSPEREEGELIDGFTELRRKVQRLTELKGRHLTDLVRANGRLRAKAFPGRASILVKLLGLTEAQISAVYEKPGSLKIGHYVPGTRIPIRSDDELFASPDRSSPLLNLAWHIPSEIRGYLRSAGYTGQVIDIISPDDFRDGSEGRGAGSASA